MAKRTKAEQETVIRWDEDERVLWIWTTSPVVRRRLERRGYRFDDRGYARGPVKALTFRRLDATGQVQTSLRSGHEGRQPRTGMGLELWKSRRKGEGAARPVRASEDAAQ